MPEGMPGRLGAAGRPALELLSRLIGFPTSSKGVGLGRPSWMGRWLPPGLCGAPGFCPIGARLPGGRLPGAGGLLPLGLPVMGLPTN
jgi:hypothetical protein